MMTVDQLIAKMTVPITLSINLQINQKALLESTATLKRCLGILEDTPLRALFLTMYPRVKLTTTELSAAPDIPTIQKKLLPYESYIEIAISNLERYIPKETIQVLKEYYSKKDPVHFIAVSTFILAVAALQQAGDL